MFPGANETAVDLSLVPTQQIGKRVSLMFGKINTSKSGTREKKGDIKARIKEAEKFVALPLVPVRLRLDLGRQRADQGGAVAEDEDDPRHLEGGLGLNGPFRSPAVPDQRRTASSLRRLRDTWPNLVDLRTSQNHYSDQ